MSAPDVSGLIDLATAPDAPTTEISAPEETSTTPVETDPALDTQGEDVSPDNTDVDGEAAQGDAGDDKPVDARTNPAAVRSALKKLRDLGPEYAPIARQLNDSFGRYNAYKTVFPKVADAQNAKALLDAVGGEEGFTSLQESLKTVQATDAKLYSGDPGVIDDILEDLKSEGKTEAFGKLAKPFLEKLRSTDEKAYFAAMKPHFYEGLRGVGFQNVVGNLVKALSGENPDVAGAHALATQMGEWFEDLKQGVDSASKQNLDPDRQAFEQERTRFQTEKQQEFQKGVATVCDSHNNTSLGSALKKYMSLPLLKNMPKESLTDLGVGLKQQLYSELSADKTYQTQMDAFFAQRSPDKDKIQRYHQAKVDSISPRIVKDLLNRRYPGQLQKGVAAPAKKATPAGSAATPGQPQKPQYVPSKPDWNDINWDMDPTQKHYITGRAVLKSGRFISWNVRDKK
jgi:hypothetical protein